MESTQTKWETREGHQLTAFATSRWATIQMRSVKCGDTKTIKHVRRVGLSKEDSDKLIGLAEIDASFGGIGKLKSKIESEHSVAIRLEVFSEDSEETQFTAERCDSRIIHLQQRLIDVAILWEKPRLFRSRSRGSFHFTVNTDDVVDIGTVTRNDPACGCGMTEERGDVTFLGIKIGKLGIIDQIYEAASGSIKLAKLGLDFSGAPESGQRFEVDPRDLPPDARFWANLRSEPAELEVCMTFTGDPDSPEADALLFTASNLWKSLNYNLMSQGGSSLAAFRQSEEVGEAELTAE